MKTKNEFNFHFDIAFVSLTFHLSSVRIFYYATIPDLKTITQQCKTVKVLLYKMQMLRMIVKSKKTSNKERKDKVNKVLNVWGIKFHFIINKSNYFRWDKWKLKAVVPHFWKRSTLARGQDVKHMLKNEWSGWSFSYRSVK